MHERKRLRLEGYDYSTPGAYFVTICTHKRLDIFGKIEQALMLLNENGKILEYCWRDLINHYCYIKLDEFIIMPNHFHGIVWIVSRTSSVFPVGCSSKLHPTGNIQHGLPEIIRGLKTFSSRRINEINPDLNFHWQRSYYDRIIRNEKELNNIRNYIIHNPINWEKDNHEIY